MFNTVKTGMGRKAGGLSGRGTTASAGLLPAILAHGATGAYDEVFIFGGIGLVIAVLIFMSWRAGRNRKREERRRRRRR